MYTGWGLVDRIFGHVDLVNKALGLVNKPKWHFEMACMLLMITCYFTATAVMMLVHLNTDSSHCNECLLPFSVDNKCHLNAVLQLCNDQCALQRSDITQCICIPTAVIEPIYFNTKKLHSIVDIRCSAASHPLQCTKRPLQCSIMHTAVFVHWYYIASSTHSS